MIKMTQKNTFNITEKLIIAAYRLAENKFDSFSAEDLVVSSWKHFPDTFGLKGYRNSSGTLMYPDSNRVFAEIMGSKPIRKRGLLIKTGTKKYKITESGKELARLLLRIPKKTIIEKAGLLREVEVQLKSLLESRAVRKFKNNQLEKLTFFDACNFWNISTSSTSVEMKGKFSNLESILNSARKNIGTKTFTLKHRGQTYSISDLDFLTEVHQILKIKFKDQLKIIEKRKDER